MEERSLFISSCSRRELARRRPNRALTSTHVLGLAVVLVIALSAFIAAHGGL